jgi:hypothetical protein
MKNNNSNNIQYDREKLEKLEKALSDLQEHVQFFLIKYQGQGQQLSSNLIDTLVLLNTVKSLLQEAIEENKQQNSAPTLKRKF